MDKLCRLIGLKTREKSAPNSSPGQLVESDTRQSNNKSRELNDTKHAVDVGSSTPEATINPIGCNKTSTPNKEANLKLEINSIENYSKLKRQQKHVVGLHDSLTPIKRNLLSTLGQIGEDWLYLALLGIIMALLSFSMDYVITLLLNTRLWFSQELGQHGLSLQYLAWCLIPVLLVTFGTGFVHLCSPTVSKTLN